MILSFIIMGIVVVAAMIIYRTQPDYDYCGHCGCNDRERIS